jgi:geranylgeranyl diphosphate synthase type II
VTTAAAPTYPDHLRREVEAYLEALRFAEREPATAGLEEAMRYSLLAGGKRIRPVLALATARAVELEVSVLPFAAALELIHTYSLIHDDLPAMDDDDLRRGRATCHVVYGEDVAILAGDGLYAEAFRHVLEHQQGDPRSILAAMAELAAATGVDGMVGGQYIDVAGLVDDGTSDLRRLHELKTGRLIGASVECVLLLSGDHASPRLDTFREFAAELGVLFQIVDDILDVTGTDDALGKPRGSDERHGKSTYVSSYGLEGARAMAAESHGKARDALQRAMGDARPVELEHITDFIYKRTS